MKKGFTKFLLLFTLGALAFVGCKEDDPVENNHTSRVPIFGVSPDEVELTRSGDLRVIFVTNETDEADWNATRPEADSWLTLTTDQNSNRITVYATANKGDVERTTEVTVFSGDNEATADYVSKFSVRQPAEGLWIEFDPISQTTILDNSGAAQTIGVTHNAESWDISIQEADLEWLNGVEKIDDASLKIAAMGYIGGNNRSARIVVTATSGFESIKREYTVFQEPGTAFATIKVPTLAQMQASDTKIHAVILNNLKIAEICLEYLYVGEYDEQRVTIYPMNGASQNLQAGIDVYSGGGIVWNVFTNKPSINGGNNNQNPNVSANVYYVEGRLSLTQPDEVQLAEATIEPLYFEDTRGDETFSYKLVKIGTNVMMAENLKATKWVDGTDIPFNQSFASWISSAGEKGLARWPFHDPAYGDKYGVQYNGYAIVANRMAPRGWRIPTKMDFDLLESYVTNDAYKLKAVNAGWDRGPIIENVDETDVTGFNCLPGGYFNPIGGDSNYEGRYGGYWTDTYSTTSTTFMYIMRLRNLNDGFNIETATMAVGYNIRLIRN